MQHRGGRAIPQPPSSGPEAVGKVYILSVEKQRFIESRDRLVGISAKEKACRGAPVCRERYRVVDFRMLIRALPKFPSSILGTGFQSGAHRIDNTVRLEGEVHIAAKKKLLPPPAEVHVVTGPEADIPALFNVQGGK